MAEITPGHFHQIELRVPDLARAVSFYAGALGWSCEVSGLVAFADAGAAPIVSLVEVPVGAVGTVPYVLVADIAATARRASELGLVVLGEPADAGPGQWVDVVDRSGNLLGLWQAARPGGPTFANPAPAPFCWVEWRAEDLTESVRALRQLFGWTFEILPDVKDFAYTGMGTIGLGLVGGTRLRTATYYVRVASLGDTARRIEASGGALDGPARPAPDGGRMQFATDPFGIRFGLFGA